MDYFSFGHRLPEFLTSPLFGDRKQFGCEISYEDPDWEAWKDLYLDFYQNTQKAGIGKIVNDAGYSVLRKINIEGKKVLEFGPGILPHIRFWNGKPRNYTIIDNKQSLIDETKKILDDNAVPSQSYLVDSFMLPVPDSEFDFIFTFYSLEHLNPLDPYLKEMKRALKPGGILIGGIPAEGGLAWGLGRYLTSRRFIKRKSSINPDKIICWEHPNFADTILSKLDHYFIPIYQGFWPLLFPFIDTNLVIKFMYKKGS